jgi:hypothetical protein
VQEVLRSQCLEFSVLCCAVLCWLGRTCRSRRGRKREEGPDRTVVQRGRALWGALQLREGERAGSGSRSIATVTVC